MVALNQRRVAQAGPRVLRMKTVSTMLLGLCQAVLTSNATTLLPSMEETQARASADLVGEAKVLAIAPRVVNGVTAQWASVITIEILTAGVSAKTRVTVLWYQGYADMTLAHKGLPDLGQKYRVYLRLSAGTNADFEPVHPDWGFLQPRNTDSQKAPTFIEKTVQRGETLWAIAAHYYGVGGRWSVLRAANFTNDAALGVYPLKPGMRLRIPTFPMKSTKQNGATNASHPILSGTNLAPSALPVSHYDAAEAVFRSFLPRVTNTVFFISYGSGPDVPQDFLARFQGQLPIVTNASAATIKTNFAIIHSPTGREGVGVALREFKLFGDTGEAQLLYVVSGGSFQHWRIVMRREGQKWVLTEKKMESIGCP